MGRRALTPRPPGRIAVVLALLLLAGCRDAERTAAERFGPEDTLVAIGVVGLRPTDVDPATLPTLSTAAETAVRWTDVLASGTGTAGALAVLDGRPALDHVRRPRDPAVVWQRVGRGFTLHGIAPTLRSEPEAARALGADVALAGHDLTDFAPATDGGVHALLVDPFAHDARPAPGAARTEGLRWIDTQLVERIEELRARNGVHVLLFGIVRSPRRSLAPPFGPGADGPVAGLRVPMLWWAPEGEGGGHVVDTPITARDPLATVLGLEPRPTAERWATWFNANGGGVVLATADRALVHRGKGPLELFALDGGSVVGPDLADAEPATVDSLGTRLATILFGGRPRAWIAVRGSEAVDFVDLTVLTTAPVAPWALEEIDTVRDGHDRVFRVDLAAEPRADGVIVDLRWPPVPVEARITGAMAEASWLGPLVHLGVPRRNWGRSTLRLEPWSRAFWAAGAGSWPERADTWWRDAPVGLHAVVAGTASVPAPATWSD